MKKLLLFLFISNLAIAQTNYEKLAKDFIEIKLPYTSTKDYFPKVGYDEKYGAEFEFEAKKGGIIKDVTTLFKDNFEYYEPNNQYFSIGKFYHKNLKGILYYEVSKSDKDGSISGVYKLLLFDKDNKMLAEKYIAEHYYAEKTITSPAKSWDTIQYSKIYIKENTLVIESTDETIEKERDDDYEWQFKKKEIKATTATIDQLGTEIISK